MGLIEIIMIALSLSMDAFAVSLCKGLSVSYIKWKYCFVCGLYFGFFQAFMPFIGYYLGISFQSKIESIDHWLVFILLIFIGFNMIKDSFSKEDYNNDFSFMTMFPLSIATSIDALAIGISFAFLKVNLLYSILIIGFITFLLSFLGVKIGAYLGIKFHSLSQIIGGIVLIIIGFKILIEHLL